MRDTTRRQLEEGGRLAYNGACVTTHPETAENMRRLHAVQ